MPPVFFTHTEMHPKYIKLSLLKPGLLPRVLIKKKTSIKLMKKVSIYCLKTIKKNYISLHRPPEHSLQ